MSTTIRASRRNAVFFSCKCVVLLNIDMIDAPNRAHVRNTSCAADNQLWLFMKKSCQSVAGKIF